jgi:hypothetical protein
MNRVQRIILGEPHAKAGVGETPVAGPPGVGVPPLPKNFS